jgi:hypothetical protein
MCVGENIVNKIHHRTSKCILLVVYAFLDLINARKMEHIKAFCNVQLAKHERRTGRDEGASHYYLLITSILTFKHMTETNH